MRPYRDFEVYWSGGGVQLAYHTPGLAHHPHNVALHKVLINYLNYLTVNLTVHPEIIQITEIIVYKNLWRNKLLRFAFLFSHKCP